MRSTYRPPPSICAASACRWCSLWRGTNPLVFGLMRCNLRRAEGRKRFRQCVLRSRDMQPELTAATGFMPIALMTASASGAAEQVITPAPQQLGVAADRALAFTVGCTAAHPCSGRLSGLGLRLHWDSPDLREAHRCALCRPGRPGGRWRTTPPTRMPIRPRTSASWSPGRTWTPPAPAAAAGPSAFTPPTSASFPDAPELQRFGSDPPQRQPHIASLPRRSR